MKLRAPVNEVPRMGVHNPQTAHTVPHLWGLRLPFLSLLWDNRVTERLKRATCESAQMYM